MYIDRLPIYKELEAARASKVLVYITGDRANMQTRIGTDVFDFFVWHLDRIKSVETISLYIYTPGGITSAARTLVNLIRQFCKKLEVIIPSKALSAGTLMCLGADNIIMTKQATLGPIDPSLENPLNPEVEQGLGLKGRVPVSVEDIEGFLEHSKKTLGKKGDLSKIYLSLMDKIHPLILGSASRARSQIRMLAEKLLSNKIPKEKINNILQFLCSESGSHDYTINRKEAKDELGLPIEIPNDPLYSQIKDIYDNISEELLLTKPFNPNVILGKEDENSYTVTRALIESITGGSHKFISEGVFKRAQINTPVGPQLGIQDKRTRDEWVYQPPTEEKNV